MLEKLNFELVLERYGNRLNMHQLLRREFDVRAIEIYVPLALGISNRRGNYSAFEHGLGPEILRYNPPGRIFNLAEELNRCDHNHVPRIIYERRIDYLKISVGSEMGMMLRPNAIWVGNIRTYWVHSLIDNNWNVEAANTSLEAYQNGDLDSEIAYRVWRDIYVAAGRSLQILVQQAEGISRNQQVEPGNEKYLWADAIATSLYEMRENLV